MCFVFAIIAVAKKAADLGDKMRQSIGGILGGLAKGILIILCLTVIMTATLDLTNALMQRVSYIFSNAEDIDKPVSITYTDEEYAAMARVLNTIGNYSVNPSYDSRYNINSCFNEIRTDLQFLQQKGVFDLYYVTDENNPASWQSVLQQIVNAASLDRDLKLDVYNAGVSNAILSAMKTMQTDSSFAPLQSYERKYASNTSQVPMDRLIFLMCTMNAAKNEEFNISPTVDDQLRGAYYIGDKSIYSLTDVNTDFDLSKIDFLVLFMVAFKLIWDFAVIIINCVARIFNLILLYLIAPPCIATLPLDDGGKMKQWMTAFVVQCFGVFGTVIAMRILLIFIPIVVGSDLVLFDSYILNLLAKVLLVLGGMETAKRASGMVTGILADNAGWQAVQAGDMGESVRSAMDHGRNRITGYGETGSLRKNDQGIRSMFGGSSGGGGGSGDGGGGGSGGGGSGGKGDDLPKNESGKSGDKDSGGSGSSGSGSGGSGGSSGSSGGSGGSGGTSIPKPPPMPTSNGQGKYVPTPPPMPVSNGQGKYVPTPPPMPGGSGSSGIEEAPAKPNPQAAAGGGFGTSGAAMENDGSGPVMEMQDFSGKADREWGSVEEFMASDGGFVPDAPDISQTEHFDDGLSWLPEGDVMTADSFAPAADGGEEEQSSVPKAPDMAQIEHFDEGRDWLPDGDVLTADSFAPEKQGASQGASQGAPQGASQGVPQGASQGAPQGVPQAASQGAPQGVPQGASQGAPQGVPQAAPQAAPQGASQGAPQGVPQGAPQGVPQGAPQAAPTKTPPPPRPAVPGAQHVKPGADPLSNINWK